MPLTIPKEYAPGLAALTNLSDDEVSSLTSALADIPETIQQRKDITSFIKKKIGEGRPSNVDELIRALLSIYQARGFIETPPLDKFVEDLTDAVKVSGLPEFNFDEAGRLRFVKNMRALLGIDTLVFLAKANALQRDHERIFHTAKILTDLRPVFHAAGEQPKEMILEYTLKIVFHDGSRRHREIYMVLDERDIVALREAIDRAEQKATALRSLCGDKSITLIPSLTEA